MYRVLLNLQLSSGVFKCFPISAKSAYRFHHVRTSVRLNGLFSAVPTEWIFVKVYIANIYKKKKKKSNLNLVKIGTKYSAFYVQT